MLLLDNYMNVAARCWTEEGVGNIQANVLMIYILACEDDLL